MARIAGITLPKDKRVIIGLTSIYGVGLSTSQKVLEMTKINPNTRVRDLTPEEVNALKDVLGKRCRVEGELRSQVLTNIKRLKEIGSYRGLRHIKHLPARGQRTRTNTRTVRGNVRRTMGSGRKPSAEKT